MPTQEQITYVVTQRSAGFDDAAIKDVLKDAGYREDAIEALFAAVDAPRDEKKNTATNITKAPRTRTPNAQPIQEATPRPGTVKNPNDAAIETFAAAHRRTLTSQRISGHSTNAKNSTMGVWFVVAGFFLILVGAGALLYFGGYL